MIEDTRTFELKVGLFVLMGLIILFIIVFSIGDIYLFKPGYHIKVIFNFANGIAESAPVRLAGVQVGEVEKIDIFYDQKEQKTKVKLYAWINKVVRIERDADARINTLGLLGEKYLEIFPGKSRDKFLKDNDILIGHDPIPVETLTEDIKNLVTSANEIVNRLKEGQGTMGKLLVEEKIYNDLQAFVEDIKKHPWKLLHRPREAK